MPHPTSPIQIHLHDTPIPAPPPLLTLLTSHLPHSLPVLRRLQFAANFPGGRTPHTHVLYARHAAEQEDLQGHFAVACIDLSRAPETQVWVYSSLERRGGGGMEVDVDGANSANGEALARGDGHGSGYHWERGSDDEEAALDLVLAVLRRTRAIAAARQGSNDGCNGEEGDGGRGEILVGSLHETIRQGLLARGVRMDKSLGIPVDLDWEYCGKWLFRVEDLLVSGGDGSLPEGMRWDKVRKGDVEVVQGRTSIKRQEATLLMLPSTVVRLDDGTPVAWAFMGLDGTIITLHVEEPYRRLGIAKALACKLMQEHLPDYGDDGWGAADVFCENHKSQALCRSIGGKNSWTLSWAMIDLSSVGDPM